jgi:hypothetical protein
VKAVEKAHERTGLPVVSSSVLSAIASGDGGSFSEGGSLLGLRSSSEVGGENWRTGKWRLPLILPADLFETVQGRFELRRRGGQLAVHRLRALGEFGGF